MAHPRAWPGLSGVVTLPASSRQASTALYHVCACEGKGVSVWRGEGCDWRHARPAQAGLPMFPVSCLTSLPLFYDPRDVACGRGSIAWKPMGQDASRPHRCRVCPSTRRTGPVRPCRLPVSAMCCGLRTRQATIKQAAFGCNEEGRLVVGRSPVDLQVRLHPSPPVKPNSENPSSAPGFLLSPSDDRPYSWNGGRRAFHSGQSFTARRENGP